MRSLLAVLAVVLYGTPAGAVSGTVFADADRDGVHDSGEAPLAGIVVSWESLLFTTTGADGSYQLDAPADGMIWARNPEGYEPTPIWRDALAAQAGADLGLVPAAPAAGPYRFVDVSDIHLGNITAEEALPPLRQAIDLDPAPAFLVLTGDMASNTKPEEYEALAEALAVVEERGIPIVPVVGNHDWHDGGFEYRARFGPPVYSFDAAGARFLALDCMASEASQLAFVTADLADAGARPVIAFLHYTPDDAFADALADAGVDWLFTGHAHANRLMRHGTTEQMTEVNTQTFGMGGIDYTPAGYRVVTVASGGVALAHHTVVVERVATMVHPRNAWCVRPGVVPLIAAIELGGEQPTVTVSVDGAAPVPMTAAGGWAFTADVTLMTPGLHEVELTARGGVSAPVTERIAFCITPAAAGGDPTPQVGSWPQLQAGGGKRGAVAATLAPPLHVAWSRPVGGHLLHGSVVVDDGRLFAPVVDLADEAAGGVVALDATTGEPLWEERIGASVRGAPAVADGVVVFAGADGVIHARDAATGQALWTHDLGEGVRELNSWTYASPTIADGVVHLGSERQLAALDVLTGAPIWTQDPGIDNWAVTLAGAAVDSGIGVAVLGRGREGVFGFDAATGDELWRIPLPLSLAVNASPILDGDTAFFSNVESTVVAVDAATGDVSWERKLYDTGVDWGFGTVGSPALADGRLFIPTPLDDLYAVDAASGARLWEIAGGAGVIRALPYKVESGGFVGAVAVAGDVVWAGGLDGVLRAVDAATGAVRWSIDLGAPIVSGIVPAGQVVYVGTYDGVVHALVPGEEICQEALPPNGCGCRTGGGGPPLGALLGLLLLGLPIAWIRHTTGDAKRRDP